MDREPSPDQPSLTEEARRMAAEQADKVRRHARSYIDQRKVGAAEALENVGAALTETAEALRRHELGLAATAADRAGRNLSDIAHSLAERDIEALARDARDFARREPGLFVAASAALGFVLARFLRSSAPPGAQGAF